MQDSGAECQSRDHEHNGQDLIQPARSRYEVRDGLEDLSVSNSDGAIYESDRRTVCPGRTTQECYASSKGRPDTYVKKRKVACKTEHHEPVASISRIQIAQQKVGLDRARYGSHRDLEPTGRDAATNCGSIEWAHGAPASPSKHESRLGLKKTLPGSMQTGTRTFLPDGERRRILHNSADMASRSGHQSWHSLPGTRAVHHAKIV